MNNLPEYWKNALLDGLSMTAVGGFGEDCVEEAYDVSVEIFEKVLRKAIEDGFGIGWGIKDPILFDDEKEKLLSPLFKKYDING